MKTKNAFGLVMVVSLAAGFPGAFHQGNDEKEEALIRLRELNQMYERFEEIVRKTADRLEVKEPENAKRLREAWKVMAEQVIKADLEDVSKMLTAGHIRTSLTRLDEIRRKLLEVLKVLLDDPKTRENKPPLDPAIRDFPGMIGAVRGDQDKNTDTVGRIAGEDLIRLLKEILTQLGDIRAGLEKDVRPSDLQKKVSEVQPRMAKALELIHSVAKPFAHEFLGAMDRVKQGGAELEKGERRSAEEQVRGAEKIIRKILNEMERRQKDAGTAGTTQKEIGDKINKIAAGIEGVLKRTPADSALAPILRDVLGELNDARSASSSAEKKIPSDPSGSAGDMKDVSGHLVRAGDVLQGAINKERQEILSKLEIELTRLIVEQVKINGATARLDKVRTETGDLSRQEKIELKELAGKQKELSVQAGALQEIARRFGLSEVIPYFGMAAQDMSIGAKLLGESRTGAWTQRFQEDDVTLLRSMLAVVRGALSPETELALLVTIQRQIKHRTEDLGHEVAAGPALDDFQKDRMNSLNVRQGVVIERMDGVIGRIR